MPGFLIAALIGGGGFLVGVVACALALRLRPRESGPARAAPAPPPAEAPEEGPHARLHRLGLVERALRAQLRRMRWADSGSPVRPELERLADQVRMLARPPRPLQARPTSPIDLVREAAEEVEALRLGKVAAAWTLLTRQPIHVDPSRARPALRELLHAGADAVGEGGRIAVRIRPSKRSSHPVAIEIEVGRSDAEPDALAYSAARAALLGQGARVEADGPVVRLELPSVPSASDEG